MMKAVEMMTLFMDVVADYHQVDTVDQPMKNPFEPTTFKAILYEKNWIDTVQWHLEDIIRDPNIKPDAALAIKRKIDHSNQQRTDMVEKLDDDLLARFHGVDAQPNARINTESPGWAIDRLSILALKIYHMQIEANRVAVGAGLKIKNAQKLTVLRQQEADLTTAIDQLLEDLAAGKRVAKVYRQMKMYNDPELNPVLYNKK